MTQFGQIIMAINNLADKCHRKMDPPLNEMTLEDKLDMVKVRMFTKRKMKRKKKNTVEHNMMTGDFFSIPLWLIN